PLSYCVRDTCTSIVRRLCHPRKTSRKKAVRCLRALLTVGIWCKHYSPEMCGVRHLPISSSSEMDTVHGSRSEAKQRSSPRSRRFMTPYLVTMVSPCLFPQRRKSRRFTKRSSQILRVGVCGCFLLRQRYWRSLIPRF